jgi:hypothetical protein
MCMCLASPLASLASRTRSFGWWYCTSLWHRGMGSGESDAVHVNVSESRTGVGRLNLE